MKTMIRGYGGEIITHQEIRIITVETILGDTIDNGNEREIKRRGNAGYASGYTDRK
jgi:hypothetical protein